MSKTLKKKVFIPTNIQLEIIHQAQQTTQVTKEFGEKMKKFPEYKLNI